MRDLQSRLASLVHVHRQLLRKYAVVDVECGELSEAVAVRASPLRRSAVLSTLVCRPAQHSRARSLQPRPCARVAGA